MPDQRPNFILYITDQHRADFLGCYGHPVLRTPHIDAMAANGVVHDKFYVASPVCMPNRASLMTARLPSSHGVRMNGQPLSRRNVTFVELLRDAGYDTALIGKSHLQTLSGQPPMMRKPGTRAGYHRGQGDLAEAVRHDLADPSYKLEEPAFWAKGTAEFPLPFYGFDHVDLVIGHGDGVGGHYREWLYSKNPDADSLIGPDNQLPHDYVCPQAVRTALPEDLYQTSYIAEQAEAWLARRKDTDKPFFLMVSFPDPHHPFNPPGHYWDMYAPEDMAVPAAYRVKGWTPPPHVARILHTREEGKANLDGLNSVAITEREALEARALTCGMITMIDDKIGQVQAALSDSGHGGNTVTIFTSDHGDHLGDHRMLLKGAEQYEDLIRVPFIWADPRGVQGQRTDAIGQTHDIGTTILERARVEAAYGMQGRDLMTAPRDAALIQYSHQKFMDGLPIRPHVHTLRDARYRISVYQDAGWGELYDLKTDPGEFTNLWDDPASREIKLAFLERLTQAELAAVDQAPAPVARA
ncbi:MAG: sulfatase [Qingshengfaniella sp.]